MTKRAPVTNRGIRMPILLTSKEVAQMVRVDPSTLSRWRARGTGPRVVWLSKGSPRYVREDVLAWLERMAR